MFSVLLLFDAFRDSSSIHSVCLSILQLLMLQKQQEYIEQQKALEEQQAIEKQKEEQERIDQIKNKKKDEESKLKITSNY